MATAPVEEVCCRLNTLLGIISDVCSEFEHDLMTKIEEVHHVEHCSAMASHPHSNGLVDRMNRKFLLILCPLPQDLYGNWKVSLPQVQWLLTFSVHSATVQTMPFENDLRIPCEWFYLSLKPLWKIDDVRTSQKIRSHDRASSRVIMYKQHRHAEKLILVRNDAVLPRPPFRTTKLDQRFVGPLVVMEYRPCNRSKVKDLDADAPEVVHAERLRTVRSSLNLEVSLHRTGLRLDSSDPPIPDPPPSPPFSAIPQCSILCVLLSSRTSHCHVDT